MFTPREMANLLRAHIRTGTGIVWSFQRGTPFWFQRLWEYIDMLFYSPYLFRINPRKAWSRFVSCRHHPHIKKWRQTLRRIEEVFNETG